jgi:hypothetical protein
MLSVIFTLALFIPLAQPPPPNVACSVLTPAQVMSLIGTAKTLPVTSAPNGSTCMFQNGDKMITVLVATASSAGGAQGLFDAKKRVVAGSDIAGWGAPAYAGAMKNAAACGVLRRQTLTEVKVIDATQKVDAIGEKLQAVMKEFAARK